jgi:hypothetical protein
MIPISDAENWQGFDIGDFSADLIHEQSKRKAAEKGIVSGLS